MKSTICNQFKIILVSILILGMLVYFTESTKIKNESNSLSKKLVLEEAGGAPPLFTRQSDVCKKKSDPTEVINNSFPKKKRNPYKALELNKGAVTYLIDYVEEALKLQNKLIQSIFKSIFDDAKSQTAPPDFKEPYSLLKVATGNPFSTETLANDELYQKWLLKDKKFNKEVYENSITVGQIASIFKTWRWTSTFENLELDSKNFVDQFDYDGDGRLNFKEFIIAMIIKTRDFVNSRLCTRCLEDVILDLLDPMFTYLDCNQRGMINSEELWGGMKYLNRKNPKIFDIYNCKIKHERFRTSSVNDFILKINKKQFGFVTRKEFKLGVLIALWDRYTTELGFDENIEKTRKEERWGGNGEKDSICDKITQLIAKKESD